MMLVTTVPATIWGDEIRLVPGLAVKEEFNDNVFLAVNSQQSDFITTITPSLNFSQAAERYSYGLSGGVNALMYSRYSDQNSLDFNIGGSFNYKYDPRLSLSGGADYAQDSRRDQVDQNGVTVKSGSERQNYRLSGSYAVSEKSTSNVSYAYRQTLYDNPMDGSAESHTVNIGQDYNIDRHLRQAKLVGNFRYFRSLNDTSNADNYALTVGLTRKINELWDVSANAGGSYTHTESDLSSSGMSKLQDDDQGWTGNLSLNYNGEKTSGSLIFSHDVIPSSNGGRGGAAMNRTGASLNVREKFTRDLKGSFELGYSHNESLQSHLPQSTDEESVRLNCGLRYEFTNYVALEGNYLFNYVYYNNTSWDSDQNVVSLRLTIQRDIMDLL